MKVFAAKVFAITATALVALNASPVHAQAWPSKPITLVVSLPPGGGTDASVRPLALLLSKQRGSSRDRTEFYPKLDYNIETDLMPLTDILNRTHAEVVKAISKTGAARDLGEPGFRNDSDDAGTIATLLNADSKRWAPVKKTSGAGMKHHGRSR